MSVDIVIKNGTVVTHAGKMHAGIAVDKGKVVAIADESLLPPANRTIDASGKYILPGLIDTHMHICYPEKFGGERLTYDTGTAAAGGITTFAHFIRSTAQSALDMFDDHRENLEKYSLIDGFFHAFTVGGFLDGIPKLREKGLNSFKFLLGYKGDVGPRGEPRGQIDDGILFDAFERISKLKAPAWAMVHCEDAEIHFMLKKRLEAAGRKDFPAWNDSRPNFVEAEAMRRVIYFAQLTGCPLYIVHITIGEGVDLVAEAKVKGINIIGETCSHYLTHTSEEPAPLFNKRPTWGIANPPLRDKKSIARLWEGIRDGWISTIGSDTGGGAVTIDKDKGDDIWNTIMGFPDVNETILPVMLSEGVNKGRITLEKVAEVCSYNAARIFGRFPEKGTIAVGSDADLVIVDLHKKVKIKPGVLHTTLSATMYDGWEFEGWPVATIAHGEVIVEDGKVTGKPGRARWLAPH